MKAVIAIDSFKGSLSSLEAGESIKEGILKVYNDASVCVCPMADGGEGTVEAIVSSKNGSYVQVSVGDPLNRKINAKYGMCQSTAIMEMSAAAGITLINGDERDPLKTTTFGVGQMIADAIKNGCRDFIMGIGGSATNDGGIGMLTALGYEFLDENGVPVSIFGEGLRDIKSISTKNVIKELKECTFRVACDVKNTLCGENGCSRIFGPQKGLTEENIVKMDKWLENFADLTKEIIPNADKDKAGAGAAGGLGFALTCYLNATLESGIDIVIKETGLENIIKEADIVITGEGRLDGQSQMGKAPYGVAMLAKKYNKKTIAFAGCVTDDAVNMNRHGIDAFFPILKAPCSVEKAMEKETAQKNLTDTSVQVFRLIKSFQEV